MSDNDTPEHGVRETVSPNGEEIKRLRALANMTQADLAVAAELSPRAIRTAEKDSKVSRGTVVKIAAALGCKSYTVLVRTDARDDVKSQFTSFMASLDEVDESRYFEKNISDIQKIAESDHPERIAMLGEIISHNNSSFAETDAAKAAVAAIQSDEPVPDLWKVVQSEKHRLASAGIDGQLIMLKYARHMVRKNMPAFDQANAMIQAYLASKM